ncbi:hypothetical protein G7Z17_g1892 [Cylindrodendrum hubeiense]|uniref:Phosphatidylinositol-specific phospholipase C X domain-containing protein n=1 Tax=Cylindrodendrum hubeiense TaxID=595255 RepID=A0A9P5HPA2_9HYPO|nr:hypothetical protein G7Z17_g1892 [Cylindrodendrum hubeiense]
MPSIAGCHSLLHGLPRRIPVLISGAVIFIMVLSYLLLSMGPCMVWGVCYHGYQSAYSFDADLAHHPTWMGDIPDEVPITSLSIPGTHDTMTYTIGSEGLQCQNWNLSMQLDAGLRYFDIRARLRDDELQIYHGNGYTGYSFTNVLVGMFEFLDANPSETIIMRLKQEGNPIGSSNTISFEDSFNRYRQDDPVTTAGANDHLYIYNRTAPLPTLGELRSKIFILQQFPDNNGPYGLLWEGNQMVLEDLWIIPDIYHLADKWTAIRNALELAATSKHDNSVLYLAHVSASIGVLPIEAAAGPLNRTVSGMNDMTGQWVEDFELVEDATRTGIVILDFPGRRLIDAILRWNQPLQRKVRRSTWSRSAQLSKYW